MGRLARCLASVPAALLFAATLVSAQDNILVILADDMGVDLVGAYAEHPNPARTPVLDALAERGVLFRNVWSNPVCSPTRAGLLTGRYSLHHGIGSLVNYSTSPIALPLSEITIPEMLAAGTGGAYSSVVIGKWHLGSVMQGGPMHAQLSGFDGHYGSLTNLGIWPMPGNYNQWLKNQNGELLVSTDYATSVAVDDTLVAASLLPEPWFLYLAFNAPHKPLHAPPSSLHTYPLAGSPGDTPGMHVRAMIEAMDTEIGRLFERMDPEVLERTTVVFLGDNGTDADAISAPFDPSHGKGTLFEGGVNVPFIVAGPAVTAKGSECAALVNTTDVFATVAEIAGVDLDQALPRDLSLDSVSLVPYLSVPDQPSRRRLVFTERFKPNGSGPYSDVDRAVRDARFKVIRTQTVIFGPFGPVAVVRDALFDLLADPFEQIDLTAGGMSAVEQVALDRLTHALDVFVAAAD